jgi:hypothetical protein
MLGPPKSRRLDQPIAVSLEDLVPQDHFYRHLEATLDLSFVREWVSECYAEHRRAPGCGSIRVRRGDGVVSPTSSGAVSEPWRVRAGSVAVPSSAIPALRMQVPVEEGECERGLLEASG